MPSTDDKNPAAAPYSAATICCSVLYPLRRMGLAKKSASTRQPSPAPSVNHRAENPLVKASCAVPMVEAPPTSVPMREPMTIAVPAREPPVEKSSADETLLPDQTPIPVITSSVPTNPIKCAMPSRISFCASRNKKLICAPFSGNSPARALFGGFPKKARSGRLAKSLPIGARLFFYYTLPPLSWQLPTLRPPLLFASRHVAALLLASAKTLASPSHPIFFSLSPVSQKPPFPRRQVPPFPRCSP